MLKMIMMNNKQIINRAKYLVVTAKVGGWDSTVINGKDDPDGDLIPCRSGDYWQPIIDIEEGVIVNWDFGKSAEVYYKICDQGSYTLFDSDNEELFTKYGYVIDAMCPMEAGYGDYIIMDISKDGNIKGWAPCFDDIFEED